MAAESSVSPSGKSSVSPRGKKAPRGRSKTAEEMRAMTRKRMEGRLKREAARGVGTKVVGRHGHRHVELNWEELPGSASYAEEVSWVFRNYPFVVRERDGKSSKIYWSRVVSGPPSQGCCGLMKWAAKQEHSFFKDVVPKVLGGLGNDEEDERMLKRRERAMREEIERSLAALMEEVSG